VISSEIKGNTQEREKRRKLTVHAESISFKCYSRQAVFKASKKTNSQSTSSFEQYISLQLPIKLDRYFEHNYAVSSSKIKTNIDQN
jgi:hypothetical protein